MSKASWKERRQGQSIWKFKFLSFLSSGILIIVIAFLLILFGAVIFFATQVPSADELTSRFVAQSTKIFDRNNEL